MFLVKDPELSVMRLMSYKSNPWLELEDEKGNQEDSNTFYHALFMFSGHFN